MRRLRLASLALACGLLSTLTGCCAFCEDGQLFPRLFRSNSQRVSSGGWHAPVGVGPQCECQHGAAHLPGPPTDFAPGQIITMPPAGIQTTPIPITNVPVTQPPNILKVPQAAPTPYFPGN